MSDCAWDVAVSLLVSGLGLLRNVTSCHWLSNRLIASSGETNRAPAIASIGVSMLT